MNKSDLIKIIEKFEGKLFNSEKLNTINNLTTNLQFSDDSMSSSSFSDSEFETGPIVI